MLQNRRLHVKNRGNATSWAASKADRWKRTPRRSSGLLLRLNVAPLACVQEGGNNHWAQVVDVMWPLAMKVTAPGMPAQPAPHPSPQPHWSAERTHVPSQRRALPSPLPRRQSPCQHPPGGRGRAEGTAQHDVQCAATVVSQARFNHTVEAEGYGRCVCLYDRWYSQ